MNRPGETKPSYSTLIAELSPVWKELNKVIAMGEAKHGLLDWQKHNSTQFREAFFRHLVEHGNPFNIDCVDQESVLPHIDHMIVNLLYWRWHSIHHQQQ